MSIVSQIFLYITISFFGYLIGRIGHYYLADWFKKIFNEKFKNFKWTPHHWIYGFGLMMTGITHFGTSAGAVAYSFGVGHFISDISDYLGFKIFGPSLADQSISKVFWGID